LSKTFSESTLKVKQKYNLLDRSNQLIGEHYNNLELDGKFMGHIDDIKTQRYKL
jgi:hypothetical protein